MHKLLKYVTSLVIIGLTFNQGKAQDYFSPFSVQGLGQLRNQTPIHNLGMGGVGIAFSDSTRYSLENPGTLGSLRFTTVDIGVKGGVNQVNTRVDSITGAYDDAGLNYLMIGFPIDKKRGMAASFGVLPYSASGYLTSLSFDSKNKEEEHIVSGGLSQAFLAYGMSLSNHIKLGARGSFLFGNKTYEHNMRFDDPDIAITRNVSKYLIRGFSYRVGAHSEHYLKWNKRPDENNKTERDSVILKLGAYFSSSAKNRARREQFATSFFILGSSTTFPDTIMPMQRQNTSFSLPNSVGFGAMFTKQDNWMLGFDASYGQWSELDFEGTSNNLNDEMNLAIGGSIVPVNEATAGFFGRMEYSLGFNYRQSFLNQNNNQVNGYSTTFGLGLPLRKTFSRINIAFEYGKLGNVEQSGLSENYYNLYLGFTINEEWFQKRKIN